MSSVCPVFDPEEQWEEEEELHAEVQPWRASWERIHASLADRFHCSKMHVT